MSHFSDLRVVFPHVSNVRWNETENHCQVGDLKQQLNPQKFSQLLKC